MKREDWKYFCLGCFIGLMVAAGLTVIALGACQ